MSDEKKPAAEENTPGISCPKCGCTATGVYYTRKVKGSIRRKRTCFWCKHQFITREKA